MLSSPTVNVMSVALKLAAIGLLTTWMGSRAASHVNRLCPSAFASWSWKLSALVSRSPSIGFARSVQVAAGRTRKPRAIDGGDGQSGDELVSAATPGSGDEVNA